LIFAGVACTLDVVTAMLVPSTPPRRLKRLALAAAFVYMAASAMWIWLSDWGAAQLAGGDAQRFHLIQTVKGWGRPP
jgi:hypothetical protein